MTVRKVLELGQTASGSKAIEAVTETCGTTTNFYYQVTHGGQSVLQTVQHAAAQRKYNNLH